MRRHATLIRNFAILAAVTTLFTFWGDGLDATSTAVNQIALIVFAVGLFGLGYQYFRDNRLKWLVIKQPLRIVIVACAVTIVALIVLGPWLLADYVSLGAVWALAAALALVIVWIVVQSRRD